MNNKSISVFLLHVLLSTQIFTFCSGRAFPEAAIDYNGYSNNQQIDQVKFPLEEDSLNLEPPGVSAIESNPSGDGSEILKQLPPNIDLNNLTPEQKEVFDELVALAQEEDSEVQGRTFGLIHHKFAFLWNKFVGLFSPHKFFEFEYNPSPAYGHSFGGGNDYPLNRVHEEKYQTGPPASPWQQIPSLFGGLSRLLFKQPPETVYV